VTLATDPQESLVVPASLLHVSEPETWQLLDQLFIQLNVSRAPARIGREATEFLACVYVQLLTNPGAGFSVPSALLRQVQECIVGRLGDLGIPPSEVHVEDWPAFIRRHGMAILRSQWIKQGRSMGAAQQVDALGKPYEILEAANLESLDPDKRWLIEQLWQYQGAGMIGGAPKGAKTWLALDMALSVASGTPCLDAFAIPCPGPVLVHCAEGGQGYLKQRLDGLCRARGLDLAKLRFPFYFLTDRVRIDSAEGRSRLRATVGRAMPCLLLLDPLVRLHRMDENSAGQVAELLGFLSELQRDFATAVVVVHHTAKTRRSAIGGQDLRGSSDFYAWGDSNLFLQKQAENIYRLSGEHRAAPSPSAIRLQAIGDPPVLKVTDLPSSAQASEREPRESRYEDAVIRFVTAEGPSTVEAIRRGATGGNRELGLAVQRLALRGVLTKTDGRWELSARPSSSLRA